MKNPLGWLGALLRLFTRKPKAAPRAAPPISAPRHENPRPAPVSRAPVAPPEESKAFPEKPKNPTPKTKPTPRTDAPPPPSPLEQARVQLTALTQPADLRPLRRTDLVAAGERMRMEPAVLEAVRKVEAVSSGFEGERVKILFEPHIFHDQTKGAFSASHPTISYPKWDRTKYPRTQAARWEQMALAFSLDPEAALKSASYGLFQIMGFNWMHTGVKDVYEYVRQASHSELSQMRLFEAYVIKSPLAQPLREKDWKTFARLYNGSGQVELYSRLLSEAYEKALTAYA